MRPVLDSSEKQELPLPKHQHTLARSRSCLRCHRRAAAVAVAGYQADAGASAESYLEVEKVLPRLLAAVDDPHFKVSH
jgi:hypothetical protein